MSKGQSSEAHRLVWQQCNFRLLATVPADKLKIYKL